MKFEKTDFFHENMFLILSLEFCCITLIFCCKMTFVKSQLIGLQLWFNVAKLKETARRFYQHWVAEYLQHLSSHNHWLGEDLQRLGSEQVSSRQDPHGAWLQGDWSEVWRVSSTAPVPSWCAEGCCEDFSSYEVQVFRFYIKTCWSTAGKSLTGTRNIFYILQPRHHSLLARPGGGVSFMAVTSLYLWWGWRLRGGWGGGPQLYKETDVCPPTSCRALLSVTRSALFVFEVGSPLKTRGWNRLDL